MKSIAQFLIISVFTLALQVVVRCVTRKASVPLKTMLKYYFMEDSMDTIIKQVIDMTTKRRTKKKVLKALSCLEQDPAAIQYFICRAGTSLLVDLRKAIDSELNGISLVKEVKP